MTTEISDSSFDITEWNYRPSDHPPEALIQLKERVNHLSNIAIAGINGINASQGEAQDHARYIQQISNHPCNWTYNQTHGPAADLAEVFLCNYLGYSPNTSHELQSQWTLFHEQHQTNPKAKFLQICHSQGAIHVRNALANLPEEIRNRIIVVAIAPGAIVPDDICFKSYNYACKTDPIPHGERTFAAFFDPEGTGSSRRVEEAHKQLILLDPDPNAPLGINHDFQNPIFLERLRERISDYINRNGEYE